MQSTPPPKKKSLGFQTKPPKFLDQDLAKKSHAEAPPGPEKKSKVTNNKNEIYTCISHNTKWK